MLSLFFLEMLLVVLGALAAFYVSFLLTQRTLIRFSGAVDQWFFSSMVFGGSLTAVPTALRSPGWRHLWAVVGVAALVVLVGMALEWWQRVWRSTTPSAIGPSGAPTGSRVGGARDSI